MFLLILFQILIDGRDANAVDNEGQPLPTLVYLAREKRPQFHHHFKGGAMNAMVIISACNDSLKTHILHQKKKSKEHQVVQLSLFMYVRIFLWDRSMV